MSNAPRYNIDVAGFWADPYPDLARMRKEAPAAFGPPPGLAGIPPPQRHLQPGKAHRPVLLAPAGRPDERADGAQHDAQGRRCAYVRARADVSGGVATGGEGNLAEKVPDPCRPHPRRARAGRAR